MSATQEDFTAYVAARYGGLVRTARLLLRDPQQAEDLVQASLFATSRRWSRLDPVAADAYVRTVMVRLAGRWQRRLWLGERPSDVLPEVPGRDAHAEADLRDALARALSRLPHTQRAVLVLRYYEQLSEAEIAAVLDCSPGTVKSRAARGLQALRDSGLLDESPLDETQTGEPR